MKEGWEYKRLKDVATFTRGLTYSKNDEAEISNNIVLRSNNVDLSTGKLNFDELKYLKPEFSIPEEKKVKKGSLLMCMSNGSKIHLGKVALINKDYPYAFGGFMALVTPNEELTPQFFHYSLSSPNYKDFIKKLSAGANINNIKVKELELFTIPVPPLSEQQSIVDYLDSAFAKIDAMKANAEKALNEAKALFQTSLKEMLEPKDGWEVATIGELGDIFGRIGFRGYTKSDLVAGPDEGAITLSPSNIQDGRMDYTSCTYISWFKYVESPEIMINNGDVLIVKTGSSYGKSAFVENLPHKATINPQSVVIKNIKINNKFFAYLIRTPWVKAKFDEFVSGAAIPTFSQAKLSKVELFYPSNDMQIDICRKLDSLKFKVDRLQANFDKISKECDALKQAILRQVFE